MRISTHILGTLLIPVSVAMAQKVQDEQEIRRTLSFQGSMLPRSVLVDNIRGSIRVSGYGGDSVEVVVHRTNYAESPDKLEVAKQNVVLDIKEERDRVLLYVDAPWRTRDGIQYRGWHYYGYDVECDFELKIPVKCNVYVKTVNDGEITVDHIAGDFEAKNVNGSVALTDIAGSGVACTVNGPVKVAFTEDPQHDCTFTTVNGQVEVGFPADLSADLTFKTFNGSVYTDFDVSPLPRKAATVESHRGRKVYLSDKSFGVRVGRGGPQFKFETLNGSIHILKNEK